MNISHRLRARLEARLLRADIVTTALEQCEEAAHGRAAEALAAHTADFDAVTEIHDAARVSAEMELGVELEVIAELAARLGLSDDEVAAIRRRHTPELISDAELSAVLDAWREGQ